MTVELRRIALLDDYQGVARSFAHWASLAPTVSVESFGEPLRTPEQTVAALADFDVVVAMRERTAFGADVLSQLPRLRLLVTTGMANPAIDMAAAAAAGVTVCGTESLAEPVVELTWTMILQLLRGLPEEVAALRAGAWQTVVGRDLFGKTLAIAGPGRIGERVAQVGAAFGMHVVAWSPNLTPERAAVLGVESVPDVVTLAQRADVLSVHLRLADQSRGLIDAQVLAHIRPDAILVNTARSAIVDEQALLAAVNSGRLAGAGLDVFDIEPLPADSPLLAQPRIICTPHMGYVSERNYAVYYTQALDDIQAFQVGEPIRVLAAPP